MEKFIQNNQESEAVNSLELLLNTREYWLPSIIIKNGVYVGFNNNRCESFFSSFKQRYGFALRTATVLIKQLQNNASLELSSSIASFLKTYAAYDQVANRNLQVQQLFKDFFEKLDEFQGAIQNEGMSPI